MPYAFELFFDIETDREVRRVWRTLADVSGSHYLEEKGVFPHVALAAFDAPNESAFEGWKDFLSSSQVPDSLIEDGRDLFGGGVCFVRFKREEVLMRLHKAVVRFCRDSNLVVSPHYIVEA